MKKFYILFLALSLFSCKCSPVVGTTQQRIKDSIDVVSSNWILRAQKDSLKLVIAHKDSMLEECGCLHPAK